MPQIFSRGDSVYQCDTCNRRARIPANPHGMEVIQRCVITNNCPGKLHKVVLRKDINKTPATTPKIDGVTNWVQRRVLFDYVQGVEAVSWPVEHNLGSIPTLQVFINKDTSEGKISIETTDYTTTIVDSNTITISFENAQSGTIQCIAHASQNTTNPQQVSAPATDTNVQISNSGILTLITPIGEPNLISVDVLFINPIDNTQHTLTYANVDTVPDAESPWAGAYQVMVAGKLFDVRTFDITTEGTIVNGSQMIIKPQGDPVTVYKTNMILLGKPPYSVPDRITDKYIDLATVNSTLPEMFYTGGEVLCSTSLIKNTYPPIVVVE